MAAFVCLSADFLQGKEKNEDVLDSLGKRLSYKFFDNEEIKSVLVKQLQQKAKIVDHDYERTKEVAEEKSHQTGGILHYFPAIWKKDRRH